MLDKDINNPFFSKQLIGLDNYFDELINLYKSKKFPKALLLSGQKGLGKFTLVNHFLNYIFSESSYNYDKKEIDIESSFYKKSLSSSFQNILYLKNDGLNKLKINDIRNLKSLLQKTNIDDGPRFVILDDVENINLSSSNALLKILEEPSADNFFILIDNKQDDLIQTIASRCIKMRIFVKNSNRKKIINFLNEKNKLKSIVDFENTDLSPGLYLRYNLICSENDISNDDNFHSKIDKLLKLYKKTKDRIFISFLIYIIDNHFYRLSKNSNTHLTINEKKIEAINCIKNFVKYNLSLSTVQNSIQSHL